VTRLWQRITARRTRVAALLAAVAGILTAGYVVVTAVAAPVAPVPDKSFRHDFPSPPSVTVTFPSNDGVYNLAHWTSGCAPAGICGTANPNGSTITSVSVGIFQQSSGRYWTGSSFSSRFLVLNRATGTTTWHYPFTPPRDGDYSAYVQAASHAGTSRTTVIEFSYDTVLPGAPLIISHPANPTTSTSATFVFTEFSDDDLTFFCYLDAGSPARCSGDTDEHGFILTGQQRYTGLAPGPHCFYVYATDRAGNTGPAAKYCWTISVLGSGTFTVGGSITTPLYPGTSQPLDLTFTNPGASPITIASGGVTGANIAITTNKVGCAGSNFTVSHGLTASVIVPANQLVPVSLQTLAIPQANWPVIAMLETHTNQDACEGATLTLTYSGIGAS
jgi:hypothetical protein